jgi:hypothetical protein
VIMVMGILLFYFEKDRRQIPSLPVSFAMRYSPTRHPE